MSGITKNPNSGVHCRIEDIRGHPLSARPHRNPFPAHSLGEKIHLRDAVWQAEHAGRPSGSLFKDIPEEKEQWKSTPLFQMTTAERLAADIVEPA